MAVFNWLIAFPFANNSIYIAVTGYVPVRNNIYVNARFATHIAEHLYPNSDNMSLVLMPFVSAASVR